MGGCCCSSRKPHLHGTPVYYYCPPALEEHESLTTHNGAASAFTAGLLAELNLNTSTPDTFRPPPAPLPYDLVLGCRRSSDSESVRETVSGGSFETLATCEDLEEPDCKTLESSLPVSPKKTEIAELDEAIVLTTEEEDACPICLEGGIVSLSWEMNSNMTHRIQNLSPNVNTIFTYHAFWSGWKGATPVLYVIRKWCLTAPSINS
ncbi:probable E3 ubiquitin-protein ligase RHB1A isoform X2 [Jatropha curcas]|nr:probable E3 ubiquitin-protein ligase RHB1A isoform X2 [Jatropha curcas]XP_037494236.1 probable E3 ubiquitin-protein ligase RHB1A isoform X2 [Jatropha curcas]